jgi:hypothetical protein
MLSIGIIGLPNVGKSTLFKALTKKQVDIQNYPFCTIEPNVGIVAVPDQRLQKLSEFSHSAKTVPAAIEFIDIAGLVAGAHKGEGLGNQFLTNIREANAILHVVRAFEDTNITHTSDKPEPRRDAEIILYELIFKDLETLKNHLPKTEKKAKANEKDATLEMDFLRKLIDWLEKGKPANDLSVNEKEKVFLKQLNLLSAKPILYLINCASNKPILDYPDALKPALELDIKLENELSELSENEMQELRKALPQTRNNIDELISTCYTLLGLETFFTSGEQESRAWTIKKGTRAPQAAGEIHTDFEAGFIRADIIYWEKLISAGSWAKAKEQGLVRTEGKEYIVQDGDTVIFKFN